MKNNNLIIEIRIYTTANDTIDSLYTQYVHN